MNSRISAILIAMVVTMIPFSHPADDWSPDPNDVAYISKTIWGEARGCSEEEQAMVAWCILNRVDDPRFPNTIKEVVTAPHQFQGYSPDFPSEPCWDVAEEVIIRWHNGEHGIDESLVYFSGDGKHNYFRSEY